MSEHLENVRRAAERGLRYGQQHSLSVMVDVCQHILDELLRHYQEMQRE